MTVLDSIAPLSRADLADAVADHLRDLILSGRLKPGTPLAERELAERLNVSRTPVREALACLQRDGLAAPRGRRGLQVTPISPRLVRESYPLIGAIERLALESAPPQAKTLDLLDTLNARLVGVRRRKERMKLDRAWHDALLRDFGNEEAKAILASLKQHAERSEAFHFDSVDAADRSCEEHAHVVALLRNGRNREAAKAINAHWCDSGRQLLSLIAASESA